MKIKKKYLKFFMNTAIEAANLSYCTKLKVGAIAVKDNNIISIGYNGTLPNTCNDCEDENNKTFDHVIHAEQNVIYNLSKRHDSSLGATLFVTHAPCEMCAAAIVQSGFKEVFFLEDYKNTKGIEKLIEGGVLCFDIKNFQE